MDGRRRLGRRLALVHAAAACGRLLRWQSCGATSRCCAVGESQAAATATRVGNNLCLCDVPPTPRFDCVIHFAGRKYVNESVEDPLRYYDHNVKVGRVQAASQAPPCTTPRSLLLS